MAASMVAENWEMIMADSNDNSENFEFSQINHNLLMSLLDETQVDHDCDDERLTNVIRSLEAEIGSETGHYTYDNSMWDQSTDLVDCQSSNNETNGTQDGSSLAHQNDLDDDLHWMQDMETTMPCSPADGVMSNWYNMDHHGQTGMMTQDQFGAVKNFSNLCYGNPMGYGRRAR